jgi:hypothetical protein
MARDVLWDCGMPNQALRPKPTAVCLAITLGALAFGARAARADEAEASGPPAASEQPAASEPPAVSGQSEAFSESVASEQPHAVAQPEPSQLEEPGLPGPRRPETSWYGWQTLLSDLGVIGLWSAAYAVDDAKYGSASPQNYDIATNVLGWAGLAVYALGAPAIHAAHGNGRKALGSLGLRIGLPLGGALAGALIGSATCGGSNSNDDVVSCPVIFGLLGFLGGGVAAPIVDAAVVAREPVTPPEGPRFQAAFVPSASGGTFVFGGRF